MHVMMCTKSWGVSMFHTCTFQSKALNATGKPIFFNACEWGVDDPWKWMAQYANSWRTGSDHHDEWRSTAEIIEINADKGKYAGTETFA